MDARQEGPEVSVHVFSYHDVIVFYVFGMKIAINSKSGLYLCSISSR